MTDIKLPKDWKVTKVSEIAQLIRGINYTKDVASNIPSKDLLPILRGNNINVELNFEDLVYVPKSLIKPEQIIKRDDIIFAMSSGSKHLVGKTAVAKNDFNGSYGAFCALLRIDGKADKKYISFIFKGNRYRKLISEIAKGSGINNLKREHILDFEFPLPPLSTQQAIVSKIEELFSELDNGIANLKTAQQQLKTYRQSVLKWAFEGKLTNKKVIDGELPKGWKLVKIGDVCKCIVPNRDKPKSFTGDIKWVTTPNLTPNSIKLDYENISLGLSQKEVEKYNARVIPVGGVIMTCVGTFGLSAIVEKPLVINQQLHAFISNEIVDAKYIAYCIQLNKYYFERKSTSTTIQYVNKENCNSMPLPLPSIEQQQQIVQEIESRLSVADKMEESITQSLQQAEALRQSILKKAFEGKLI